MCELCEGTGGVAIQHTWGVEHHPCNHPQCDFDRDKAIQEQDETIEKMKTEIYSRRNLI